MDNRYKLLLAIIVVMVLVSLFYYLDSIILSGMTGTRDFNRFGIAFILSVIFVASVIWIAKHDC